MKTIMRGVLGVIALAVVSLVVSVLFGSWYTVDQGERAVVLRNGAFVSIEQPGFHGKLPIVDSAVPISIRTEKRVYCGGDCTKASGIAAYSKDIQLAHLHASVQHGALHQREVGPA